MLLPRRDFNLLPCLENISKVQLGFLPSLGGNHLGHSIPPIPIDAEAPSIEWTADAGAP
jgi:hypothetical protein